MTITDVDNNSNSATVTDSASVADAVLTASCATPVTSVQIAQRHVASLIDANPTAPLSNFSATIDWGDSSTSSGTVTGGGPSTISGTHNYSSTG